MGVNDPSPRSHLVRLGLVFAVGLAVFFSIKAWQTPETWNEEVWYRGAAREDIANLPSVHGGNQSCQDCHEDAYDDATSYAHENLSCEGCHGPLSLHVRDDEKIADARPGASNWLCLNCHSPLISRPTDHPQFSSDVRRHEEKTEAAQCVKCHDGHDPEA